MSYRLHKEFERSFNKRQYTSVLLQSMLFSFILVALMIIVGMFISMCRSGEFIDGIKKMFDLMWYTYISIFVMVTGILFIANRNRRDLSGLDETKEFSTFETAFKEQERDEKIKNILDGSKD